jgi:hypothetical protein
MNRIRLTPLWIIGFALTAIWSFAVYGATTGEWRVNLLRSGATQETLRASSQQAAWDACQARIPRAATSSTQYTCQTPRYVATVTPDTPAPVPVDCVVSAWSAWTGGTWSACVNGAQTRQETRTRTVLTQPANGGAACPALTEPRTATQPCIVTPPPPPPSGQVLFRETFNSPNYGFAGKYTSSGWAATHLPTGDADGSGAVRVRINGGVAQFPIGWWTPNWGAFDYSKGIYVSFRIRFDDDSRWSAGGSGQNKFILLGNSGGRTIIHIEKPSNSSGCTLGWSGGGSQEVRWLPRDFGLSGTSWGATHGSVSIKQNVGLTCSPPVAVTYTGNSNPGVPAPGATARSDGWYSITMWVKPGQGNGEFRVWVNNKEFSRPNIVQTGITMGTTDWEKNAVVGGYWTDAYTSPFGYSLGEVGFSTAFDANR